ncbi:MAG TPA: PPC domain-containing DNA-binding protein [Candidatus Paceibacterota bacterium]|nr:PPC domain-containing DNA-binding protein [Candidatus Paceibacterota bacterium]
MKCLTFRLKPGSFLKEEIEERSKDIEAGVLLSIVGALENANLRMAGATPDNQVVKNLPGPFEIVAGTGTLSKDGGHLHIAVSNAEGDVIGGHLKGGCRVGVTAEIVIGILDGVTYKRIPDSETGFKELEVI